MGLADHTERTEMGTARAQRDVESSQRRSPFRRPSAPRLTVSALLVGGLVLATFPAAVADEADPAVPTSDEVAAAEQRVAETARSVGAIKAALLLANNRLEQAAMVAAQAAEAYNGARWRLETARQESATARAEAATARRTVEEQRRAIGALVAASYQQGGDLTALNALLGADGPEGVLDHYATFQSASASLQADYDRFAASDTLARVFEERAAEAEGEAEELAEQAETAKQAAEQAAASAQAAATSIAREKERLIRDLAAAQNISVSLARRRQSALEDAARERAAERAAAEAAERARDQAAQQAAQEARDRADALRAAREQRRREAREARERQSRADRDQSEGQTGDQTGDQTNTQTGNETTTPTPVSPPPAPAPPPPPEPPRSGGGGADRAIAFAKAQLGEPYVWGAAGPSAWDCSGLMLEAWKQAGVSLPHYSVAQYYAGTPISSGDLRAGDLVFWGSSSDPSSIFHVAMYIGGGQIVHAPRTGRPVSIDSLYYWTPPSFFARL